MKILITHNDYGRYSGEEAAVDAMGEMLSGQGHTVSYYRTTTAGHIGLASMIRMFLGGIYSIRGVREMKRILKEKNPDVINIHNLYPFISPAALFACKAAGKPVVMTVHNYRLICPTGLFLRAGKPCEHCLTAGNEWGCVRYNCEGKVFKSLGYALRSFVARKFGAYTKNVDRFVCLTVFQKEKLIEAGFKADRITVIPNKAVVRGTAAGPTGGLAARTGPTADTTGAAAHTSGAARGEYIAYAGRLSEEKGWDLLVDIARRNPGLPIRVAGFVNEEMLSETMPANIQFSGYLDQAKLDEFYLQARFIVIPSRCYEGFPLVALEAMAMGKPVIGPDHGGFSAIIGKGENASGLLFQPGSLEGLEKVVLQLWQDEVLLKALSEQAIHKIKSVYSSELIYRQWEQVFKEVLEIKNN